MERYLVRLETAIWSLMVGEQKTATKSLQIMMGPKEESSKLVYGTSGSLPNPQQYSSGQSAALNLWSKRLCSEKKRKDNLNNSDSNGAIATEIDVSLSEEYKTIRQTLNEQRVRIDEFNLLYNNVQTSLDAFWSR